MSVTRYGVSVSPSAGRFLTATRGFLEADEAGNCLLLSILDRLATVANAPPHHLAAATTARGTSAVAVWRSQRAMVSRGPARALITLADDLIARRLPTVGAVIPLPDGEAFLARLTASGGVSATSRQHQRLHRIDRVTPPAHAAPGALRLAKAADVPGLETWLDAFCLEARIERTPNHAATLVGLKKLFVWQTDRPVAIAAVVGGTMHSKRIGLVFTPPAERGHGYASQLVATLSARLLQKTRFATLVTDLDNPVSNRLYARLGYQPCGDIDSVTLQP